MPVREFRANSNNKLHIFWRFSLALGASVLLLFVSSASVKAAWEMYQTFDIAAEERAMAEAELAALELEHAQMSAILKSFGSERGVEAAIRERFGVVKPGEGEIRIVRVEESGTVEEAAHGNPFSRLFNALFKW